MVQTLTAADQHAKQSKQLVEHQKDIALLGPGRWRVAGETGLYLYVSRFDDSVRRWIFRFTSPATKRVTVTDALRQLAVKDKQTTITIVPVVGATNELCDEKDVFHFEDMRFLTYN